MGRITPILNPEKKRWRNLVGSWVPCVGRGLGSPVGNSLSTLFIEPKETRIMVHTNPTGPLDDCPRAMRCKKLNCVRADLGWESRLKRFNGLNPRLLRSPASSLE